MLKLKHVDRALAHEATLARSAAKQHDGGLPPLRAHGNGIKIRCENWYWNRRVQVLLQAAIGARWGSANSMVVPWNTNRPFLIVEQFPRGWFFLWATAQDFERCPLPEWSAKALIAAYPGQKGNAA